MVIIMKTLKKIMCLQCEVQLNMIFAELSASFF